MTDKPPEKGRILIVEDSMDDFEAAARAFRKTGLPGALDHVNTAEEALKYLAVEGQPLPRLILLDLNMPGLGGRKLLERLKQHETFRSIPVVVLTTSNNENDIRMCYASGANTYIQKPVNFDALCSALKAVKEYWLEVALLPPPARAGI
jgi:two-component system response regulator